MLLAQVTVCFSTVFVASLATGVSLNSRGFLWGDALSRSTSALTALYSADPHLGAIGFVWMPLPTLIELVPAAVYPFWPAVVSSGFASTVVTAFAGGLTSVIVLFTALRLGLGNLVSCAAALVVVANPMLFLFFTNGMSEGIAAPFLIGSVCFLAAFWYTGQRRYVVALSLSLALGFACLYQAVYFGAGLLAALTLTLLFSRETRDRAPMGRFRAFEGLGILAITPSVYVAILWVSANWFIMGDPLYFLKSDYSNEGYIASSGGGRLALSVQGNTLGSLTFAAERSIPFLIPGGSLLLVRAAEGRLFRVETLGLAALTLSVPLGLIVPQLYGGESFGWLRYFMYPLFAAAGWGIYEMAISRHRRLAATLVFAGWLLAIPFTWATMADPSTGQDEHSVIAAIGSGETAGELGFQNHLAEAEPVARHVNSLDPEQQVLMDNTQAWPVAAQLNPRHFGESLLVPSDRGFAGRLDRPRERGVEYLLVPDPGIVSNDLIASRYPDLWEGGAEGFELEKEFPGTPQAYRLYSVEDKNTGDSD